MLSPKKINYGNRKSIATVSSGKNIGQLNIYKK